MKKLVVLVVLMAGISAIAQKPERERGHRGDMKDMSPEQIATLQTKQMTLALDLTDTQQKEIQSLNLENAVKRSEKMNEMKAKKESGEAKKLTSEERFAMKTAMLDHQIAQKEEMKKILNKEQYEKWEKMKKNREGHRKGRGMDDNDKRSGKK
ncbi:DUF4890 domain-containing protein [Arenibacter echinorum]|uniref:Spy/CpxP family protein refolding chaperone n=1 Tax=Arenibacter echinorum TaxID=440515 RepID=A0A327QUC3_9FLAO|nr:DUF4890 domain-containing protein [Arenibacter echinorum]RAJ07970.1 hypothetical protein LV92_03532 [Arenibacter echinorum]